MDWDCGFSTNSPEFLLLGEEEMEELRSEKTVTASKISPEEIEKLMVDETLSPIERATLLLRTGQDDQKVYTMKQLPFLMETYKEEALKKIIPKICESLPSATPDVQIAAGKSVGVMVTQSLIPAHVFLSSFLPLVIRLVNSRDTSVSSVWLETLLEAIPTLTKDVIRRDILSLAVARSQLSQTVSSRKSGCLILGAITQKFEPFWLKREVFPQVRSLCQDVDYEVRSNMCSQLHLFARHMSPDLTKSCVFPELVELLNDEETIVRIAALEAIAEVIPHMSKEAVTSSVVPLVKQFCQQALSSGNESLTGVARLLGKLSHQLRGVMTEELRDWFVEFYCQLSQFDELVCKEQVQSTLMVATPTTGNGMQTECRRLCAYNFPAILMLAGATRFPSRLSSTLQQLASDESPFVRRTVASCYHEVVVLLGDKSMSAANIYQNLLCDKSTEVLQGLSGHLSETLKGFAASANLVPETKHPGLPELIGPLLAAEAVASTGLQWRIHEQIIAGFSSLVFCLTSDQLYNRVVPVLMKNITGNCVRPVKLTSCHSLLKITRCLRRSEQRTAICDQLIKECAHSDMCQRRLLFLDICDIVLTIFSRAFFKEHFFSPALELGNDPVINVRLRVCSSLPALKAIVKLPGDRVLLRDLDSMVRQLLSQERDVDTSRAIRNAVLELDRIQVAMETLTRRTFFEADLIDQEKEAEERKLLQAEEREREREAGKKVVSAKASPVVQRALQGKKLKATRTSSGPVPNSSRSGSSSPNAGSVTTFTITSTPSPAHSPSTTHKALTVPKPKVAGGGGEGGGGGGRSPTPNIHRSHSGSCMVRYEIVSMETSGGRGAEEKGGEEGRKPGSNSIPCSPYSGAKGRTKVASRSANNSPSTGSKLSITRPREQSSSSTKRKPPHTGTLKNNKKI